MSSGAPAREDAARGRPGGIRLVRVAKLLIVAEIVWLLAANLLLNSSLAPALINRKPEKFSVAWERAWTWYPARLHARGLVFEQHTWTMDIEVRATEASASVRFLPLLGLRFVLGDVDADGLSVAILREVPEGPKPAPAKARPGFRIGLEDVDVRGLERFSFNEVAVSGGRPVVRGSFAMQIRGEMALDDVMVDWQDARITLLDQPIAESIALGFRGDVASFHPKQVRGLAVLGQVSGELDVEGHSGSLRPLELLFPDVHWIEELDGAGDVSLHLDLEEGRLQPGSRADVQASSLELSFLGFLAEGAGRVGLAVEEADARRRGQVDVVFDHFSLARQGDAEPMARGSGLTLSAHSQDLGLRSGLESLSIDLSIPDSEVPDVAVLGRMLPPGLGIQIEGGRAALSGHLEARGRGEEARGAFQIRGTDLEGSFRDMDFAVDLAFDTRISGRDLDDFEVRLEGTELKLTDGVFDGDGAEVEQGWWMTVAVPQGRANLVAPVELDAELDLSMRDTRAIIALFAEVKRWIRHFDGFLTVHDVEGSASLHAAGPRVSVQNLSLTGDRLEVMGEARLEQDENAGIFWGKLGAFSLGMERLGDDTAFKLVNGREWYEERRAAAWATDVVEEVSRAQ